MNDDFLPEADPAAGEADQEAEHAREWLENFVEERRDRVFFSRQLEVQLEDRWFHWITNRVLREMTRDGLLKREVRELPSGQSITLMWHRSHRYYRRDASALVRLVAEYADPNIGGALGLHGEFLVLEGLARRQFVLLDRDARAFGGRTWTETAHNIDFIFQRDGIAYGVEVKNTLGYMEHEELELKIDLCTRLGLTPVFAARMLPKTWINEVIEAGGFGLIFKYQLYPWAHRDLARRVREELGLPVDAPRALQDGTIQRFVRWHERR